MAGTTRFGYSGSGSGKDDEPPPAPDPAPSPPRATVYGRGPHLPPGRATSGAEDPRSPAPIPVAPADDSPPSTRTRVPSRSGKSGFPARAGFWGRRNTQGDLEEPSEGGRPARPRLGRVGRQVLVVLASALLSFVAVLLTLKLGSEDQRQPPAAAPASAPAPAVSPPPPPPITPEPGELTTPGKAPPQGLGSPPGQIPASRDRASARPPGARPARRARRPDGLGDRLLAPRFDGP